MNQAARSEVITQDRELVAEPKRTAMVVPQGEASPLALIQMAVQQGADINYLQKLMDLQERHEANEAKKAFNAAFAAFKSEAIKVLRNKDVTDGPLKGKSYAELFSVVDAVTPPMAKHGLSHSWEITRDDKDWIEVTCIICHEMGHSKSVKLGGPPDAGGAKNAIQARVSTISYLERATLKAACGVAEQNDDTDGNAGKKNDGAPVISEAQLAELITAMSAKGITTEAFCKKMRVNTVAELEAVRFPLAVSMIENTKRSAA
jgi:hypothetical protein